jgi:SecD/SecF fusion protein
MTAYYFACGFISILALILNALMLVAAMSLNQAAWSLPGIAGVILTFGMAVDANVLIYERMREEMTSGHDLRTAVRLGYAKALAAIVDGNITTLIVAVVLGFTGTQEIKGFALTLGIGTVTTLFAQLFGTRFLFNVLVEKLHWRRAGMLPMAMKWTLRPHIDWLGLRYVSYGVSAVFVLIGVAALFVQGEKLLGTEFRGGTAVTLQFKEERPATPTQPAKAVTLPRQTVVDRVTKEIPAAAPAGSPLQAFKYAEVIAVNPEEGGKSSGTYTIKTEVTDPDLVQKALVDKFSDVVSVRQAVTYAGAQGPAERSAFPVVSLLLGEVVDFPADKTPVSEYEGGVAVLLDKISPPVPKAELEARLATARAKPDYADIAARPFEVRVLAGSDQAVTAAAVLVRDPEVKYSADPRRWATDVRDREFNLVRSALTQTQTLAEVQNFSSAVASTFKAQAIVAVLISTLLVVIYVWVRFNSFRYSLAAIATTLHDCLVAIGFVGLANVLYERAPGLAHTLGILPFKIDLNVVAAVLTILGYSLNDTIIVMDRIRENRGKLPFATRAVINEAINQTVSRTIITAGTTFLATTVLYVMGGEGVRVFAYTMLVGIIVGTYSSISVAAPLVWSHAAEDSLRRRSQAGGDGAVARTAA